MKPAEKSYIKRNGQWLLERRELWQTCTGCNLRLPATFQFFYKQQSRKGGFRPKCKVCTAKKIQNQKQNRDKLAEIKAEDRQKEIQRLKAVSLRLSMQKAAREAPYASYGIRINGIKLGVSIKVCSKCTMQYPATSFFFCKSGRSKGGLKSQCKRCDKVYRRVKNGGR